jgi:hypothetical protein
MSQLNIKDLYTSAKKTELGKYKIFDEILTKCHKKIKLNADNKKTECIFQIPPFIFGKPLYDIDELQIYVFKSLKINGFEVKKLMEYHIFINWNINKPEVKENKKIKKKQENNFRVVEDYNPSGMFINNQKALMNIKDKSIKLLDGF